MTDKTDRTDKRRADPASCYADNLALQGYLVAGGRSPRPDFSRSG
jgi:hypothetical protein